MKTRFLKRGNIGNSMHFVFNAHGFVMAEKIADLAGSRKDVWRFEYHEFPEKIASNPIQTVEIACRISNAVCDICDAILEGSTGHPPVNDDHYAIDGLDPVLQLRDEALKDYSADVYRLYMGEQ